MFSKYLLPPLNIWLVANDSSLKVCTKQPCEALIVLAFLEHVKCVSALTFIGRFSMLRWIEKPIEFFTFNSKDARTLNFLVIWTELLQIRRPEVLEQIPVHRPIGLLSPRRHII